MLERDIGHMHRQELVALCFEVIVHRLPLMPTTN